MQVKHRLAVSVFVGLLTVPQMAFASGSGGPDVNGQQTDPGSGSITTEQHDGNREDGYSGGVQRRHFHSDNSSSATPWTLVVTRVPCPGDPNAPAPASFQQGPFIDTHYTIDLIQLSPVPVLQPEFAVCSTPGLGTPPNNPADVDLVNAWAKDYYQQLPLPKPAPKMSAPQGISGAEHSLDLRMDPEIVFEDNATPFGTMTMHVYATTAVTWGDGTSGSYKTAGAPWPNSNIKHSWSTSSHFDINATSQWTAEWVMGPYNGVYHRGVLSGISTAGAISQWPVLEAQAVLTS